MKYTPTRDCDASKKAAQLIQFNNDGKSFRRFSKAAGQRFQEPSIISAQTSSRWSCLFCES